MTEKKNCTTVNSWNEWDPLKHVIVGSPDGTMIQAPEPAIAHDLSNRGLPYGMYGPLPQEMQAKAAEQMDNFVVILEKRGIRVDRPSPMDFSEPVSTPDWRQKTQFGCMPARDLLLTVGNEILEATMSYRSRWFEYICYRPLLQGYFREDPNFRWEAAPKPRLTDASFKSNYWEEYKGWTEEQKVASMHTGSWALTEEEPLFDAADVGRAGKDLFVYHSSVTNAAGIDWLRRHYPDHRVHATYFRGANPTHIDATFVILRPGLAMSNPVRVSLEPKLEELFKKNDWEIIECAQPGMDGHPYLSFCSQWLSMNTLILDPNTVCVDAEEVAQMEQFDSLGYEVIPVPFRAVSAFGGGLHCATADVYREGSCEDYFPRQVEGF